MCSLPLSQRNFWFLLPHHRVQPSPGAPYERQFYALQLLTLLLQQWVPATAPGGGVSTMKALPFCDRLLSTSGVSALLGCLVDSWDKMRLAASDVLALLPAPLPGLETPGQVLQLLQWAARLQCSPRVRESDAGALALRLLVSRYLVGLGWSMQVAPEPTVTAPADTGAAQGGGAAAPSSSALPAAVAGLLGSLTAQLRERLAAAHADMVAASKAGLLQSTLLALRYTADALPWPTLAVSTSCVSLVVSASAVAAADTSAQQQVEVSSSSSSTGDGGTAAGNDQQLVTVTGPAPAVLHCWMADLLQLLRQAAAVVLPLLCAQVRGGVLRGCRGEAEQQIWTCTCWCAADDCQHHAPVR